MNRVRVVFEATGLADGSDADVVDDAEALIVAFLAQRGLRVGPYVWTGPEGELVVVSCEVLR